MENNPLGRGKAKPRRQPGRRRNHNEAVDADQATRSAGRGPLRKAEGTRQLRVCLERGSGEGESKPEGGTPKGSQVSQGFPFRNFLRFKARGGPSGEEADPSGSATLAPNPPEGKRRV